jgi:Uncharacterised nucleotidyltransferase
MPETAALATMTDLMAALVRGDTVEARALAACDPAEFCRAASRHDVLPLVAERLARLPDLPEPLGSLVRQQANAAVVADLLRESELKTTLDALDTAGVAALVIKGGHLAYSHYGRPDLRSRNDTDILVRAADRRRAHRVLLKLGYATKRQMSGDLVAYQASYLKRRTGVTSHVLDLHWRIANSQVFAGVLSYDELSAKAVSLPGLGRAARGLCDVHALLLACVHRVAHHYDSDHLVWLYDIHLIANGLSAADWDVFVALAAERKVAGVCRRSLERTLRYFPTSVPRHVWTDQRFTATAGEERTAAYLKTRRHVQVIADDLRVLPTWAARWHLLREHLFPPGAYMRGTYSPASHAPLLLLYARRLLRGGRKWLSRSPVAN